MDLLPIELYLGLLLLIPLAICFAKWGWSLTWKVSAIICAAVSWLYFNLWMGWLDPSDNGFANAVYLFTGWFWMLPIFVFFCLPFKLIENRLCAETKFRIGRYGFTLIGIISAAVLMWNVTGRMSEERAVRAAREELIKRGYEPRGRELPSFEGGHWIVRYPDTDFREIRLSKNGKMSWIGGPG